MNKLANLDNYLTDPDYAKPPYEAPIDEQQDSLFDDMNPPL